MPTNYGPTAVNVNTGALTYSTTDLATSGVALKASTQTFTEDQTIESDNKLKFGTDTNLYRVGADQLGTDDAFTVLGAYLQSSTESYLGGTTYIGVPGAWDVSVSRAAANILGIGADDAVEFTELASDAAAPAANKARLYSRDNGSGKTQLVVRFASGAVQVLATEP